ncbi:hypothetical protein K440DRAFT_555949 [Wilcoxina mikolae CBS 423.85]|nr:hypothetical protein K440DRAFT_555949 [Wilcoxina mikolae CBS 423.85]
MDDELVAQFMAITDSTSKKKAESYLKVSDNDLAQAIQLFFDTGGADIEASIPTSSAAPPLPARQTGARNGPLEIDEDDDMEDDDVRQALRASEQHPTLPAQSGPVSYEDDEAMARRLQEEFYGTGGGEAIDMENGVRAPIAKTRETLVGPEDDDYGYLPVRAGRVARADPRMRAGIFNQRTNVWDADQPISSLTLEERRRRLAEATGGASARTPHATKLADLFRPPVEIISHLPFDEARDEAKESEKWILINIQDESVFASQVLNRDIWRDSEVQQTIRENFIFLQMNRNGMDGRDYVRLYLPNAVANGTDGDLFPHVAIIDPRTGEQVKVWKEMPKSPIEFVHTLHEFLERYSLNLDAKNPVQRQTKPKIDVGRMTEEEMLQLALQHSLTGDGNGTPQAQDPDEFTRHEDLMEFEEAVPEPKGKEVEKSPFQKIASDKHHQEPPPGPEVTRIQFKLHDGSRVVRRFLLKDRVERLFEYVKADLLPEKEAQKDDGGNADREFDLVSLGKRLIDVLDQTVEVAGLKMGTVMVETMDD